MIRGKQKKMNGGKKMKKPINLYYDMMDDRYDDYKEFEVFEEFGVPIMIISEKEYYDKNKDLCFWLDPSSEFDRVHQILEENHCSAAMDSMYFVEIPFSDLIDVLKKHDIHLIRYDFSKDWA